MNIVLVLLAALLAAPLCSTAAAQSADSAAQPPALRLPQGARPVRYALTLTVVPGVDKAAGEIAIEVELERPQSLLWLNADKLEVHRASVDGGDVQVRILDKREQFLGLAFDPALSAGRHRLSIAFDASQNRNTTSGIAAIEQDGEWYAMTQFEPMSARRAFPCFDEPGFKVPWELSLRVPQRLVALSNTPVVDESPAGEGMKLVRFAPTRPLPSYLIAFAVGPWETVDVGRIGERPTPMRIVVPHGRSAEAAFAARSYPALFERLERWFGIAHPYPKLDQIAIPLTVSYAMENVGLITYGSPILLAKPGEASARFRRISASVGAHEMAHQWFGNLVTAAWWDDIWLNEAFATWLAAKMVDLWQPSYERGAARVRERAEAIAEDALASARQVRQPIATRGDVYNAFDTITYQKGATVLGMVEGWLSEPVFRSGVQSYLASRSDGNATADDFVRALSRASGRDLGPVLATFLEQNGVPEVSVALRCEAKGRAELALSQHRHAPIGEKAAAAERWQIPVCVRYGERSGSREACTLVSEETASLPLEGSCPRFVFANAGGRGYYLPAYDHALLERLTASAPSLTPAEYASFLYDLRSLMRSGAIDGGEAMAWIGRGATNGERHVVQAAIELAMFVRDSALADEDRAAFSAFVREVFGPRARRLGLVPRARESDDDALLRRSLLLLAGPEDAALAAQARRLARAWLADRHAIDAGLADAVLFVAARTGDAALFDAMLDAARKTNDGLERRQILVALMSFGDPALARRGLGLLLDAGFDIRETNTALRYAEQLAPPRPDVNAFIVANFDAFAARVDADTPGWWPLYAERMCSERDRAEVESFWRTRTARYAGAERNLAQALESIEACARVRARQAPKVAAFLRRPS